MKEIKNRIDLKWAHPEVTDDNIFVTTPVNPIYDNLEQTPAEELEKMQYEQFGPPMMKILDKIGGDSWNTWKETGEWNTYYTENGCPEEPDAPKVRILTRVPKDIKDGEKLPVIFAASGGGMCVGGTPEGILQDYCRIITNTDLRVIFVSYQYRLGPVHKYPKSINDSHAAYIWMIEHSEELHINTDKIIITGESTGGHISLSLPFRLKKYNYHGKMPRGIIVITPVMDDIAFTDSFTYSFEKENGDTIGWDRAMVMKSMKMWLGDRYGDPSLPPEAVPNRVTLEDLENYPPVWFCSLNEFEPSRDSAYKFAILLHEAGVYCDFHVWGGTTHLSSHVENNRYAKRLYHVICDSFIDAVEYDFRRPWLKEA